MKRVLVLVVALSASLASVVSAHTSSFDDANGTGYVLDFESAGLAHDSRKLIGRVTFWNNFQNRFLSPGYQVGVNLDTDPDRATDYHAEIMWTRKQGLQGWLYQGPNFLRNLTVSRHTAQDGSPRFAVRIPLRAVRVSGSGFVIRYRWYSYDAGNFVDVAPDRGWRRLTI